MFDSTEESGKRLMIIMARWWKAAPRDRVLEAGLWLAVPLLLLLVGGVRQVEASERGSAAEQQRRQQQHQGEGEASAAATNNDGANASSNLCQGSYKCNEGVILPVWYPQDPSVGDKVARAIVYFVAMIYMFLGVSIIADRFMSSIEVITSQEREITVKKPNGETSTTTVRLWNETVSNLTLMALGSSAPEILLSVIEVCGHGFHAGELGPSTIVGSAAFNTFVIIAICVYVVPDGEVRRIKHLRVFFVTAAWSIFAYAWLYLILAVISPGVVDLWESLLTFIFFPLCVVFAWVADRRLLFYKYMYKKYRAGRHRAIIIETEAERPEADPAAAASSSAKVDIEMDGKMFNSLQEGAASTSSSTPPASPRPSAEPALDGAASAGASALSKDQEEESRREMARILKELKQKHPDKEMEQLIELANYQVLSQQAKSRAFYRIQATRLMIGAGNILKRHAADQARKAVSMQEVRPEIDEGPVSRVYFDPGSYQCLENCGSVALTVVRRGGDLTRTLTVDYRTEDGTANAGSDYEFTEGSLVFKPGETHKEILVGIIDDDIFEEDENFCVHLSNLRVGGPGPAAGPLSGNQQPAAGAPTTPAPGAGPLSAQAPSPKLGGGGGGDVNDATSVSSANTSAVPAPPPGATANHVAGAALSSVAEVACLCAPSTANVTIFDDDHAGIFTFEEKVTHVSESVGVMEVKVLRASGARGAVVVPYRTVEGSARGGGEDFEDTAGELEFDNDEIVKTITINIVDRGEYEKQGSFFIALGEPVWIRRGMKGDTEDNQAIANKNEEERRIADMGRPVLGENTKLEIIIEESYEFKNTVDKLIKKTNLALVVGTNSWRDQFIEAVTVSAGEDDDDDECAEEKLPSCFDYVMHFLTVFWKVLFAIVPPTEYWNGWACFVVSICMIGILTAIIGDLASHFGCTIGLKDSVTAVVFVALGTSVPDTFASKVAAIQDQYADASIGNVTGSNAVNIFLGIGVAWTVAAIYWNAQGKKFEVLPGNLAFSVTLYTIFAFINFGVLLYRRKPEIGGELGGPRTAKILTSVSFTLLWLMYILLSSLEAYCYIKGF
ncbi:sodium/calcium exchanger 1-like isoform X6 [Chiloscyllium plagiosum]|uniref:sodium/calcium exchanger 1-like isoform X6 n=1 Tax=Chiloscyllium plagiosum TaxID=36176 RepID=UPI001CB81D8C|nr:sodium/calcium exchanger 1-like isoform X6 [Chiloscyllium plagiosum]